MFNLGTELCLICRMDYCTVSVEEMASIIVRSGPSKKILLITK